MPFTPAVEPTETPTPQAEVPFLPTAQPTETPTPTPTLTPTDTPIPVPTVQPTETPTPQAAVPFQPVPVSVVTHCRVSNAPEGEAVPQFPAGTGKVYIVFDYAYMAGEQVGIRVYDNSSNVLFEEVRTLSGDGTISIAFSAGGEGFATGRYLVNIYDGNWGVIKTVILDIA